MGKWRPPARPDPLRRQARRVAAAQVEQASAASVVVDAGEVGSVVQAYSDRLDRYAGGEFFLGTVQVTGPYAVTPGVSVVLADASSGALTVSLPAAAANVGRALTIKKTDAGANAVTVDAAGSETIDGAASYDLPTQGKFVTVLCDGTGWQVTGAN